MKLTRVFSRVATRSGTREAGRLREGLAEDLYQWRMEGTKSPGWVRGFQGRLARLANITGQSEEEAHDQVREAADAIEGENRVEAKKRKKNNPWAICTKSVGREDKDKYESCVMDVKHKNKDN